MNHVTILTTNILLKLFTILALKWRTTWTRIATTPINKSPTLLLHSIWQPWTILLVTILWITLTRMFKKSLNHTRLAQVNLTLWSLKSLVSSLSAHLSFEAAEGGADACNGGLAYYNTGDYSQEEQCTGAGIFTLDFQPNGKIKDFPKSMTTSILIHETSPGHHLQSMIAEEADAMTCPWFLKES